MKDRPTERVRVLLDGLTASAIVDRVHPYYSGYQFEGEWLDTLKESIEGELDDLDRIARSESARRFAERLEAAAAEGADVTLFGVDYTALPMDTEGNPIHIGDVMEWSDGEMFEVVGIGDTGTLYYLETRDDGTVGIEWTSTECKRHHAPTVEDVLREFAYGLGVPVADSYVAASAAKLRLAEGEDA